MSVRLRELSRHRSVLAINPIAIASLLPMGPQLLHLSMTRIAHLYRQRRSINLMRQFQRTTPGHQDYRNRLRRARAILAVNIRVPSQRPSDENLVLLDQRSASQIIPLARLEWHFFGFGLIKQIDSVRPRSDSWFEGISTWWSKLLGNTAELAVRDT